ncbi:MAG TPA: hypothetical protein VGO89_19605 [Streptomyces sp.]|jgi:hypothetical protein|nr:hypothetical protein [Streptomyces sp.]
MNPAVASAGGLPLFTRNADGFKGLDSAASVVAMWAERMATSPESPFRKASR